VIVAHAGLFSQETRPASSIGLIFIMTAHNSLVPLETQSSIDYLYSVGKIRYGLEEIFDASGMILHG